MWVIIVLWIPEEHYASDENDDDNSDDDNGDDFNGDDFICLQFFPGHSWEVNCNFQKIRWIQFIVSIDILAQDSSQNLTVFHLKMKQLFTYIIVTFEQAGTFYYRTHFPEQGEGGLNSISPNPTRVAIFKLQTIPFVFRTRGECQVAAKYLIFRPNHRFFQF